MKRVAQLVGYKSIAIPAPAAGAQAHAGGGAARGPPDRAGQLARRSGGAATVVKAKGRAPASTARELARAVLERVEQSGAFANRALSAALDRAGDLPVPDRGLATELVYGVLRRRARLDRALEAFAARGLAHLDPRVRTALRVGAYQLLFLDRVPAYAAVDDAVDACKRAGGEGVGRLANALLRRLATKGEPALPDAARDPRGHLALAAGLPEWLADLLVAELPPAEAVAFGDAVGAPAPLALRANTLRAPREVVLERLRAERPDARLDSSPLTPDATLKESNVARHFSVAKSDVARHFSVAKIGCSATL